MKRETTQVGARVELAFHERLKKLAAKNHRTVSQIVRMLLEEWAAKQKNAA